MRYFVIAQSLGEYAGGGGGIAEGIGASVQRGAQMLEFSVREHRYAWIAVAIVFALWAFRRRSGA